MASHIACEALRKGLETQIAALTAGYDNEVDRLQAHITARIARLKATYVDAPNDFRADREEASIGFTEELANDHTAKLEDVRREEQTKHQHEIAKLQAQILSLEHALETSKRETIQTKESMSKSISNLRSANRAAISELEKKHANEIARFAGKKGSTQAIVPTLRSTTFRKIPSIALKRSDTLETLSEALAEHYTLDEDEPRFDLGLPCPHNVGAVHRVDTFHGIWKTFEQLGIYEGDEIWYNRKFRPIGPRECRMTHDAKLPGLRGGLRPSQSM